MGGFVLAGWLPSPGNTEFFGEFLKHLLSGLAKEDEELRDFSLFFPYADDTIIEKYPNLMMPNAMLWKLVDRDTGIRIPHPLQKGL